MIFHVGNSGFRKILMKKEILNLAIICLLILSVLTTQPVMAEQDIAGEAQENLSVSDLPESLADSVNSFFEVINSILIPLNNFLQATIGALDSVSSMLESLEKSLRLLIQTQSWRTQVGIRAQFSNQ
jgi:hypothetical protein